MTGWEGMTSSCPMEGSGKSLFISPNLELLSILFIKQH